MSVCATNSNLQRLVSTKSLSPDRLFSVWLFSVWLFSVSLFSVWLFSVWLFPVSLFSVWLFSVFSLFYSMSKYAVIPAQAGI
ncbi:hypothetical protein, partial [Neisseria meningitidis]|uniref:hypothetical protein n=1 Tax=Neisseria meningitidis TaxID=487 RepID=UPI001E4FE402